MSNSLPARLGSLRLVMFLPRGAICEAHERAELCPVLVVQRKSTDHRLGSLLTHFGHEAPLFVAMYATDRSVILGLGVSPMRRREFITLIGGEAAARS